MSGDVQPRKRKDKKKKKDELGLDEGPRGTAAPLGEGDVLLHAHSDHGTGGHWCAKVIFFSLLAVLITLIGLIILENRGLSELEASTVHTQYSGVLEGWLEDAPDDDHHDEHTLELKHPDDDHDDHEEHNGHDDDDDEHDDHDDDDDHEEVEEDDDDHDHENSEEQELTDEENNDEDDEENLSQEELDNEEHEENASDDDEPQADEENDDDEIDASQEEQGSEENMADDDENDLLDNEEDQNEVEENNAEDLSDEKDDGIEQFDDEEEQNESQENEFENKDEDEHDDEHESDEEEEVEIEKIEQEAADDEEPISNELPALPEADDDDDDDDKKPDGGSESEADQSADEADDGDFLQQDDDDEVPPVVEPISAPKGKPFQEVDEADSSEVPVDTLAEEEEYERQQEELRRQQEEASHMWLKLGVGGALLLATRAVLRRAAASGEDGANKDEGSVREETPLPDRRMTIVPEQAPPPVRYERPVVKEVQLPEDIVKQIPMIIKSAATPLQVSMEDGSEPENTSEPEVEDEPEEPQIEENELFSDEEEEVEEIVEEEEEEEEIIVPKKETPKEAAPTPKPATPTPKPTPKVEENPEPEEENQEAEEDDEELDPDDVEIIEDEDLDEEEIEEEEISDVDDAELLSRLEAKYGRLPDPERPAGYKVPKDGGNSVDDEGWPGEPSDAYWGRQLNSAEREMHQGHWNAAIEMASAKALATSARARWIVAKAYDAMAESRRDNQLLGKAITAYMELLKMNAKLSDRKLLEITNRTLDRIQFRGIYLNAEPVHRLLIRRFPNNPGYRNNLTISFLMANRADLAEEVLKETLKLWPEDRVALAHYAFVLKTLLNRVEEAEKLFRKALEGDSGAANEPRFYYHWGDALLLLGRNDEAEQVHKQAAKLGHFLSPAQRSLYNVNRLKSRPWWNINETPYARLAQALEKSWKLILKEGEAARALYEEEKEGLREKGDWSQLDLFVRGREIQDRCKRAPITCSIVRSEAAAIGCRRGQIKFSSMEPGTHVRPHVGPTNCRLRMHLALSNTENTFMRVHKETRQFQLGKTWLFDDSFEHEVWHNGTATRLVLIVDLWHPDLTAAERRTLPAI